MPMRPDASREPLSRRGSFWSLFGAFVLGAFADNTLRMATIVTVFAAYNAGTLDFSLPGEWGNRAGSIVSMAFTVPIMLFSLIAGWLADKVDRHRLIKWLKFIELILMSFAAISFAIGNAVLLIFALFLMGAQSAFFSPVRNAVMPHYFEEGVLVRANGFFNAGLFVAIVAGLGLGGGLVSTSGGRTLISIILISAAVLGWLCALAVAPAPAPPVGQPEGQRSETLAGLRAITAPLLGAAWFWMIGAIVLAILPNYVRDVLGGGDVALSLLQVLFAIGAGLGSVGAGIIGTRMKDSFTLAGIGVAMTVLGTAAIFGMSGIVQQTGGLSAGVTAPLLALFALLLLTAGANNVFAVPMFAAVQSRAPIARRARLMGVANMANGAGASLGAALVIPALAMGLQPAQLFGILAALQSALLLVMVVRRKRAAPREAL